MNSKPKETKDVSEDKTGSIRGVKLQPDVH